MADETTKRLVEILTNVDGKTLDKNLRLYALEEAKENPFGFVERYDKLFVTCSSDPIYAAVEKAALESMIGGLVNKVTMIKAYRSKTGKSIKEGKEYVEETFPEYFRA